MEEEARRRPRIVNSNLTHLEGRNCCRKLLSYLHRLTNKYSQSKEGEGLISFFLDEKQKRNEFKALKAYECICNKDGERERNGDDRRRRTLLLLGIIYPERENCRPNNTKERESDQRLWFHFAVMIIYCSKTCGRTVQKE
jgi:hypothetical protein